VRSCSLSGRPGLEGKGLVLTLGSERGRIVWTPPYAPVMAHLYVMSRSDAPGVLKIGRSDDPVRRALNLQAGHFFTMKVLAHVEGAGLHERAVHAALRERRISGPGIEWFRCSVDEALEAFARVTGGGGAPCERAQEGCRMDRRRALCEHALGGCEMDRRRAHKRALAETSARGARYRRGVYLSWSTGLVFPRLRFKVYQLHNRHAYAKARCLAYAAEAEIAARRAARETRFPRTARLEARDPDKAQRLARIKVAYERAYQHHCYVRRTRQLERCAALTVARLLREAWGVLLAQPAPICDEGGATRTALPLGLE